MDYPTSLDMIMAEIRAIKARLSELEGHAVVSVTVGKRDLDAALAKLGAAIARRDQGGFNG